jgi:hypothetical protein
VLRGGAWKSRLGAAEYWIKTEYGRVVAMGKAGEKGEITK